MLDFLSQLTTLQLFAFLSFLTIGTSLIVVFLIHLYVPIELRYKENPVIGNMSALISIIYGVLVGLTALYLINNISYTNDAVQREANAVANVYRESIWLKEPMRKQLQDQVKNYLELIINTEWPQMKEGKQISHEGDKIIDKINFDLSTYSSSVVVDSVLLPSILESLKHWYDDRQLRIQMSYSQLSPEIWAVILIGTILTVAINYLFGMNFCLHLLTVSAGALMAAAMLFLLISLDRPFQGDFIVEPAQMVSLLHYIDTHPDGYELKPGPRQ